MVNKAVNKRGNAQSDKKFITVEAYIDPPENCNKDTMTKIHNSLSAWGEVSVFNSDKMSCFIKEYARTHIGRVERINFEEGKFKGVLRLDLGKLETLGHGTVAIENIKHNLLRCRFYFGEPPEKREITPLAILCPNITDFEYYRSSRQPEKTKKQFRKHTSSVGRSNATPYKQQCLQEILKENIRKYKCVVKKHECKPWLIKDYHVFEFTAGDMANQTTSPHIILQELTEERSINFLYYPFEKNAKTRKQLEKNLRKFISNKAEKEVLNNRIIKPDSEFQQYDLDEIDGRWHLGIGYFDPNGSGYADEWAFLENFTKNWPQIDLLINLSVTMWKRAYHCKTCKTNRLLSQQLQRMYKKTWWIRKIADGNVKWKYTMLFGTNMSGYTLSHIDFHKIQLNDLGNLTEGNYLITKCDDFIQGKTKL